MDCGWDFRVIVEWLTCRGGQRICPGILVISILGDISDSYDNCFSVHFRLLVRKGYWWFVGKQYFLDLRNLVRMDYSTKFFLSYTWLDQSDDCDCKPNSWIYYRVLLAIQNGSLGYRLCRVVGFLGRCGISVRNLPIHNICIAPCLSLALVGFSTTGYMFCCICLAFPDLAMEKNGKRENWEEWWRCHIG